MDRKVLVPTLGKYNRPKDKYYTSMGIMKRGQYIINLPVPLSIFQNYLEF